MDVVAMLFLVIPTGRFIDAYPNNISLAVGCTSDGLTLLDLDSIDCEFKPSANLSLTIEECGYLCLDSQPDNLQEANVSLPADWPGRDQPHHKFRNGLFFREQWNLEIDCSTNEDCRLKRVNQLGEIRREMFDQVTLTNTSSFNSLFILESTTISNGRLLQDAVQCDSEYDRPIRLIQPLTFKLNNSLKSDQGVLSAMSFDDDVIENLINYKICRPQCIVRAPRSDVCANKDHVVVFDPQLTFWLYTFLRIIFSIIGGGAATMFEGAALAIVTKVKGDLGFQRIFGLLGLVIFPPISGLMIDHFSIDRSIPDYRYTLVQIICCTH